jgi:hypothetical protein
VDELSLTAQNKPNSGAQVILDQFKPEGIILLVQLIPSGDVITEAPPYLTAQNKPSSGAQHTRLDDAGVLRSVQVIPSGLVTAFDELSDVEQNKPSSDDQHIPKKERVLGRARSVQVIPSGLVIATAAPP